MWQMINAIIEIKDFTNQHPEAKFKIGKTDDYQRREQEHSLNGYTIFKIIAESSSLDNINKLEEMLIKYSSVFYKENLENERDGGGGNNSDSTKYYIYLISK